jgi:choline dehydrogenase-like flavoprotein
MPRFEEFEQENTIQVTVVTTGQRRAVNLASDRRWSIAEALDQAKVKYDGFEIRRNGVVVQTTEYVEDGHVIFVLTRIRGNMPDDVELAAQVDEIFADLDETPVTERLDPAVDAALAATEIEVTVVTTGQRRVVRLAGDRRWTIAQALDQAKVKYEGLEIRRNGVVVETTEVVEHGHVIFVLTRIRGNRL